VSNRAESRGRPVLLPSRFILLTQSSCDKRKGSVSGCTKKFSIVGGWGHRTHEKFMVLHHRPVVHIFDIMHPRNSAVQFTTDHEARGMKLVVEFLNLQIN
jgi:hypothetical protein